MFENIQNKISIGKWLGVGFSTAALAGVCLVTAMVHPQAARAITMVEMPALVFPEITAQANENIMLCVNNLTGDGSVRALIGLLDVADSSRFVRGTTSVPGSFDARKGACVLLLPAVRPTTDVLAPPAARTGIPVIYLTGAPSPNGAASVAGRGLLASVQLVAADGSVRLVVTPTLANGLLLPAI